NPLWGHYNPDYCYSGGTSMSTPLVAGAAALLRQYLTQEWNLDRPSAALMKALILQSADDLFPGQYGEGQGQEILRPAPNVHEGYGRVNIDRATTPKALDHYWALIDQTDGVATGEVFSQKIPIANAGPVKVTLVYSDAPGASMASRALVNNLDLEVEAPHEPAPRIVSSKSLIDNIEQIKLNDVSVGEITVRVLGTNVPSGRNSKHAFAVVVSR
ncbi:MAG: S8 family serine peptidase, partial [Bdellovibrionales bacterium]|nr:S8 family serine peptidase [Bdellovibrionales bacterium]